jgi:DoxX-like family
MKREFERYGLVRQRVWVGSLQLVATLGLLVGLEQPWIGRSASTGLAIMMMVGVLVRLKIRDRALQIAPAFFYMILNAYLSLAAF